MKKVLNSVTAVTLAVSTVLSTNVFAGETNTKHPQITKAQLEALKKEDARKWAEIDKKYKGKNGYGDYVKEQGLILVTKDGSSGSFVGHAAIMYHDDRIVEAMPDKSGTKVGVDCGVFENANNWNRSHDSCYISRPKNTSSLERRAAADYCHDQIGKHYMNPVLDGPGKWKNERNKFYCSHLVWAGYLDVLGMDLAPGALSIAWVAPNDLLNDQFVDMLYVK